MKRNTSWFKTASFSGTVALFAIFSSQAFAQSPCDAMAADAEAISGAVPKFANGQLVSVSMYGESSFIQPKRSLIANARNQAEMQAKAFLSAFFEEQIQRNTLHESLMESVELTSGEGESRAYALEIKRTADYISSNSSAVLSGIVKLDECVDTDENYILVRMGWKPSFAEQATQAQELNSTSKTSAPTERGDRSNKPGVHYTEVHSSGSGATYEEAIRNALRSAVAQTFGEAFASHQSITAQVDTLELNDSNDNSYAIAAARTSSAETSSSATAGIIQSYQIQEVKESKSGYSATLRVVLADYQSGLDQTKQNIVVLPILASTDNHEIASSVHRRFEQQLAKANQFNLLDREFIEAANTELGFIASGNSPIEELSRLGNQVGADLLVIAEMSQYQVTTNERQVGNRTLERSELSTEVRIKIINPATSQIVVSDIVSIQGLRVPKPSLSVYADLISRQLTAKIIDTPTTSNDGPTKRTVAETKARIAEKQKKLETEHEDDW